MTRQEVPPLITLSGAVLEAQWDRVGHITLSDRCKRPVGREKKKKPRCLIFGTRTIRRRGGKLLDVASQKAGYKSVGIEDNCSSWDDSMSATADWSHINCVR